MLVKQTKFSFNIDKRSENGNSNYLNQCLTLLIHFCIFFLINLKKTRLFAEGKLTVNNYLMSLKNGRVGDCLISFDVSFGFEITKVFYNKI